jgi:hypothetical protein
MAQSGFDTFDVHMSDLQAGRARLSQFQGFVACGGFSYGDTLGAGARARAGPGASSSNRRSPSSSRRSFSGRTRSRSACATAAR